MRVLEGQLSIENRNVAIVVGRFNEFINSKLLEGAIDCLKRHGLDENHITVTWVPGSFEIPLAAQRLAMTTNYQSIICLGSVIRGATAHFDHVATAVTKGTSEIALKYNLPVIFGVLTTDTIEQAVERAGTKAGNKGWESALTAIEMMNLLDRIE